MPACTWCCNAHAQHKSPLPMPLGALAQMRPYGNQELSYQCLMWQNCMSIMHACMMVELQQSFCLCCRYWKLSYHNLCWSALLSGHGWSYIPTQHAHTAKTSTRGQKTGQQEKAVPAYLNMVQPPIVTVSVQPHYAVAVVLCQHMHCQGELFHSSAQ